MRTIFIFIFLMNNLSALATDFLAPASVFINSDLRIAEDLEGDPVFNVSDAQGDIFTAKISSNQKRTDLTDNVYVDYYSVNFNLSGVDKNLAQKIKKLVKNIRQNYDPMSEISDFHDLRLLLEENAIKFDIVLGDMEIDLPVNVRSRLLEFLLIRPDQQVPFDCCSFVHYLRDIARPAPKAAGPNGTTTVGGTMDFNKWNMRPIRSSEDFSPGDVLAIVEGDGNMEAPGRGLPDNFSPRHWFVYLGEFNGERLYISKMNNNGPVAVTTYAELDRIYNVFNSKRFVYKAIPVQRFTKGGFFHTLSSS